MDDKHMQKYAPKFYCKKCDYGCSKQFLFNQHLTTRKHKMDDKMITKDDKNMQNMPSNENPPFVCECGKRYKYRQGLSKHKKVCKKSQGDENEKEIDNLVNDKVNGKMVEFYKQELDKKDKQLAELQMKNNNMIVNNNNNFNLNVFLNETCKDALSIQDFVKSLTLTLDNLEYSKENGPEAGMINILKEGLMELDVDKRPIHCTDLKRETLYIKDTDNGWEKNSKDNNMFKTAVDNLQDKQSILIKDWKEANPGWEDDIKKMDEFNALVKATYCNVNDKKVIKNIAKATEIDKDI